MTELDDKLNEGHDNPYGTPICFECGDIIHMNLKDIQWRSGASMFLLESIGLEALADQIGENLLALNVVNECVVEAWKSLMQHDWGNGDVPADNSDTAMAYRSAEDRAGIVLNMTLKDIKRRLEEMGVIVTMTQLQRVGLYIIARQISDVIDNADVLNLCCQEAVELLKEDDGE